MQVIVVYDDTIEKSELISDVVGDISFGEISINKKVVEFSVKEKINSIIDDIIWIDFKHISQYESVLDKVKLSGREDYRIIHYLSNNYIVDDVSFGFSLKKIQYIDSPYIGYSQGKTALLMFNNINDYADYLKIFAVNMDYIDSFKLRDNSFEVEGLIDLSDLNNFMDCITGNLESRYFNKLSNGEYTIEKSSSDKKKIKSEYMYYQLIPDNMKYWFVQPFEYSETENAASYKMERLYMTDLSIKWVHGTMKEDEFEMILDKYFYFFSSRQKKECTSKEFDDTSNLLFVDKVSSRIEQLLNHPKYNYIKEYCSALEIDINELFDKYINCKNRLEKKYINNYLVIGHGDPCFSNVLYNRATRTLKFIDPRGAIVEEDLWMNPYYDIAKLSHSICGNYDFIINNMYDIKIEKDLSVSLTFPFDNEKYVILFKKKLEENGYNYALTRLYEASLFLSMLPLHIDSLHNVLGFIINARDILKEVEKYV